VQPLVAQTDHLYAYVADYLEFDTPAPFRENGKYFESILMKEDGSTSKGAFCRNMRSIPRIEFDYIVAQGFAMRRTDRPLCTGCLITNTICGLLHLQPSAGLENFSRHVRNPPLLPSQSPA
jgi:hypothetical protein